MRSSSFSFQSSVGHCHASVRLDLLDEAINVYPFLRDTGNCSQWVLPTKSSLHPKLSAFPGVSRLTVGFVDASRVGLQIPLGLGCNDCDPFHTLLIDYDRLCRRDIFFKHLSLFLQAYGFLVWEELSCFYS